MANVNIGKVALTPAGDYNSTSTYEKLDIVKDQGSSFIAKKAVPVGTTTGNDEYWQMVASIGATGPTGPEGPIGHTIDWGEIEGNIEDQEDLNTSLSTLNNTKEDLIIKSASGSIVSFDDSADYSLADLKINIEPVQSGTGDPSPTNVRPISGHTSAVVTRTGKNLFDKNAVDIGFIEGKSGNVITNQSFRHSDYIRLLSGATYTITNTAFIGANGGAFYDIYKNYVGEFRANTYPYTFVTPSNVCYIRVSLSPDYIDSIQLELGSTASAYEPYQGQQVTIDLDGTRYGGTLNVLTGEMTVNRVMLDPNILLRGSANNTSDGRTFYITKASSNALGNGQHFMSNYLAPKIASTYEDLLPNEYRSNANNSSIVICTPDANTTKAQMLEWYAQNSIQFSYLLATPLTVQLTPSQLSTLLGQNNIWANTGDINLKYWTLPSKDITTALDNKLNEVIHEQQQLITNIEPDMKASNNYVIGDLVIVKNKLLRVTQNVSSGSSFVIDSNVEQVNLTTIISEKASQSSVNTALAAKAPLVSPTLTGTPTAPTPIESDSSTKIATTEFVQNITEKKQNLIINSASGSIASFTDGSSAPVTALSVSIEPVQDLHGYSNPWPAGGGANLADKANYFNVFGITVDVDDYGGLTINGTTTDICYIRGTFKCDDQTATYTWALFNPVASSAIQFSVRNANTQSAGGWATANAINKTYTFTVDEGKTAALWQIQINSGNTFNNYKLSPMIVKSSTAPSSFTPYSNICPISGHTSATVTRTGKNLCEGKITTATIATGGNILTNSSGDIHFGAVKAGKTYTATTDESVLVFAFYKNLPALNSQSYNGARSVITGKTFTAPIDGYVAFRSTPGFSQPQLELGSTASAYEAPQIQTVTISLGEERYGGTLNVLTGTMTVDRVIFARNSSTMNNSNNYPGWKNSGLNQYYSGLGSTVLFGALGNIFPLVDSSHQAVGYNTSSDQLFLRTQYWGKNQTEWIAEAIDIQIICPLLVNGKDFRFTVQLTPSQLTTLLGQNNVWADTGDVTVKYWKQSSQDLVDAVQEIVKQSQYATRSIIGGIERTNIATKNYVVGEYVIVGDDLLKITSNISSGETLSIGTNCVKTTVAEALIALASA